MGGRQTPPSRNTATHGWQGVLRYLGEYPSKYGSNNRSGINRHCNFYSLSQRATHYKPF